MDTSIKERVNTAYQWLVYAKQIESQKDLANRMKTSTTNISRAMNGDPKYLTEGFANRFGQAFPDINRVWLLTGEGEMLKSQQHIINSNNTNSTINESATIAKLIEMIAEKDRQIAEKDKQLAEKDKQIESLLKLLAK